MKSLVYYCRWQKATLRLRGRDSTAVWGQLVEIDSGGDEKATDFRYILESARLILIKDGEEQHYSLDEKGIPLREED